MVEGNDAALCALNVWKRDDRSFIEAILDERDKVNLFQWKQGKLQNQKSLNFDEVVWEYDKHRMIAPLFDKQKDVYDEEVVKALLGCIALNNSMRHEQDGGRDAGAMSRLGDHITIQAAAELLLVDQMTELLSHLDFWSYMTMFWIMNTEMCVCLACPSCVPKRHVHP